MVDANNIRVNQEFLQVIDEFVVAYPKKHLIHQNPSKYQVIAFAKFNRALKRWKRQCSMTTTMDDPDTDECVPDTLLNEQQTQNGNIEQQPVRDSNAGSKSDRPPREQTSASHPWTTFARNHIPEGVNVNAREERKMRRRKRRHRHNDANDDAELSKLGKPKRPGVKFDLRRAPPAPGASK